MKKARASRTSKVPKTLADWAPVAERRLRALLRTARARQELRRLSPAAGLAPSWHADLRLVGSAAMSRLNGHYRGKPRATDVLSFPAPLIFQQQGQLGELVLCVPKLLSQARERKHSPQVELQILLTHGVLHLLGFDHERGPRQAALMARWEASLLSSCAKGLIRRNET